jgi:hypothetical protein
METLLSKRQAAVALGVSEQFISKRCSTSWQGIRIPYTKMGSRLRFRPSDLENFAKFHENEAHAKAPKPTDEPAA